MMTVPHDLTPADESFWRGVRSDETLRVLWSLGRGHTVSIGTLARYLDMSVEAAMDWMQNNGEGLWECDEQNDTAWRPLIGKHRRCARPV